jgi:serine/threonine-protein kinase RsbW
MRKEVFRGYFSSLAKIAEYVRQSALDAGLDNKSLYAVESAVDEACTNIIEHAYGGEGIGDIQCTCLTDENTLTIILQDQGRSFDPAQICIPDLDASLDERMSNGLGLYLIHQFMDEVHFEFTQNSGNILKMTKYIH